MERVANYVMRGWLMNGKILTYKVTGMDIQALEAWSKDIVTTLRQWQTNQYLALYDLSSGVSIPLMVLTHYNILDPGLTERGQEQVEQILVERPELIIRLAIVLPATTSGRIVSGRGRSSGTVDQARVESRVILSRKGAEEWLSSFVEADSRGDG
jgi:hypothetical protein